MEYNDQVRELLESYHQKIENEVMTSLSNNFTKFYSGVTELYGKLKNKGLIKDDPYFKASEIVDVHTPDDSHFEVVDTHWKVAERFTQYEAILSFIAHNFNFSLNTFNFDELEKLKKFIDYYNWKDLTNPSATDQNTQSLGKIVISYRNSTSDSLVINTFDTCLENINKSINNILKNLKIILLYLKESYKQFIRVDILPIVLQKDSDIAESKMVSMIASEISNNYSYLKLYKKYINEVVKEEFFEDGASLKENVIKKLTLNNVKDKKVVTEDVNSDDSLKLLLLELGKVRIHFAAAIDKLFFNHNLLQGNKGNIVQKLLNKISKILFNITPKTIYNITLKEKNTPIHFEKFYRDIKKIEFELLSFTEEYKVENYIKENQAIITNKIDRLLMNLKKQTTVFLALDNFLKVELKVNKVKGKGIKPEIAVIKSIINSSTSLYREYLSNLDKK